MSALYWICRKPKGPEILDILITADKALFVTEALINALCLPLSKTVEKGENSSCLTHLCENDSGQSLLEKLVDINPGLFATRAFTTALKRPCRAKNNISPLTLLKNSDKGNALLLKIAQHNSTLSTVLGLKTQENKVGGDQGFFKSETVVADVSGAGVGAAASL